MKFVQIKTIDDLQTARIMDASMRSKVAIQRATYAYDKWKSDPRFYSDYELEFTNMREFLTEDGLKLACNTRLGVIGVVINDTVYRGSLKTILSMLR